MSVPKPSLVIVALAVAGLGAASSAAQSAAPRLRPRAPVVKPPHTVVSTHQDPAIIAVKFRDGLKVRLRDGMPSMLDGADTPAEWVAATRVLVEFSGPATGASWQRAQHVDEATLDELRGRAERRIGRAIADQNLEFFVRLSPPADAAATIDALNALDVVELASPVDLPVPPPLPPNYEGSQGYLKLSPGGIDATFAWSAFGNRGAGIKFADIEYTFNASHQDLPAVTVVGATPQDPGFGPDHGTAVLGEVAGKNNGWGVTGICSDSSFYFAGTYTGGIWNIPAAITNCIVPLDAGDVLIIEQQVAGPLYTGQSQFGLVPVEWNLSTYNAILTAVGNGIIVVEAAGNGEQNLDAATYSQGNGGHWPFLPANDSGAIIVGAGASPGGSDVDRSRLWYSNYGSRLDVQGWGEAIYTAGYGDKYSSEGATLYYTDEFGGTSGATPIVGGACVLLQSISESETGALIDPATLRDVLIDTGTPQQSGDYPASQKIGPRPNLLAALTALGLLCPADLNSSGAVDGADLGLLLGAWGPCPGCEADLDGDGAVSGADLGVLLGDWGPC